MPLEMERRRDEGAPGEGDVEVTERLALTEDDRLVPETDPEARWFWKGPGQFVSRDEARKYGLVGGKDRQPEPEPEEKPVEEKQPAKRRRPAANKKRKASENK